jgi:hypothetical protein
LCGKVIDLLPTIISKNPSAAKRRILELAIKESISAHHIKLTTVIKKLWERSDGKGD